MTCDFVWYWCQKKLMMMMRVLLDDEEDDGDDDGWGCCLMMMTMMRVLLDGGKSWHKEAWMSHTRLRQDVTRRHSWAATSEESHHQAGVTKCYKVTQVVTLVLPSLKNCRLKKNSHLDRELEPLKEEKSLQSVPNKLIQSRCVWILETRKTKTKLHLCVITWVSTLQFEGSKLALATLTTWSTRTRTLRASILHSLYEWDTRIDQICWNQPHRFEVNRTLSVEFISI